MWRKALFTLLIIFILTPFGSPPLALALGLAMALTIGNPFPDLNGKPTRMLLQTSVILLGFGMNLKSIYEAGKDGIVLTIATIFGTLALGHALGKLLKVRGRISALISTGTAICGGSAIAAAAPGIEAEPEQISISLGTALISLAITIYNSSKDPDANRSRANSLLQRARTLLPARPETSNEFLQLLQLINAMAGIEPAEAFRNFEPAIDQINQLTDAWAIVNAFQGGNVRQGEYVMGNGLSFGLYIDPSTFRTLAQKDLERTMSLIDGLQRREMRITFLTSLLESGF